MGPGCYGRQIVGMPLEDFDAANRVEEARLWIRDRAKREEITHARSDAHQGGTDPGGKEIFILHS